MDTNEREYELTYLVSPLIAQEQLAEIVQSVRSLLETAGSTVLSEGEPKIRPLSYNIWKVSGNKRTAYDAAYFASFRFRAAGVCLPQLQKDVQGKESILRALMLQVEPPKVIVTSAKEETINLTQSDSNRTDTPVVNVKTGLTEQEMDREIDQLISDTPVEAVVASLAPAAV